MRVWLIVGDGTCRAEANAKLKTEILEAELSAAAANQERLQFINQTLEFKMRRSIDTPIKLEDQGIAAGKDKSTPSRSS